MNNLEKIKGLATGSNGYYFIDGFRVEKSEFYQEKISRQLDEIEKEIKEINDKLKNVCET